MGSLSSFLADAPETNGADVTPAALSGGGSAPKYGNGKLGKILAAGQTTPEASQSKTDTNAMWGTVMDLSKNPLKENFMANFK